MYCSPIAFLLQVAWQPRLVAADMPQAESSGATLLVKARGLRILILSSVTVSGQSSDTGILSCWQQTVLQLLTQGLRHDVTLETRGASAGCLPS